MRIHGVQKVSDGSHNHPPLQVHETLFLDGCRPKPFLIKGGFSRPGLLAQISRNSKESAPRPRAQLLKRFEAINSPSSWHTHKRPHCSCLQPTTPWGGENLKAAHQSEIKMKTPTQYWGKQGNNAFAVHAVNMLLVGRVFEGADFDRASEEFDAGCMAFKEQHWSRLDARAPPVGHAEGAR